VIAWHVEQTSVNVVWVDWKWTLSKYGTAWDEPGPFAWQAKVPQAALKQDGPLALGGSALQVAPWQEALAQLELSVDAWARCPTYQVDGPGLCAISTAGGPVEWQAARNPSKFAEKQEGPIAGSSA
jgi:hypothetical protein